MPLAMLGLAGATGSTTITATSGTVSGTTTLTVTPAVVTSITVAPANPSIAKGMTQQFTATGTYTDGTSANLTNSATWSSSNLGVATIDASGLASALAAGGSTISATYSGVTGTTT